MKKLDDQRKAVLALVEAGELDDAADAMFDVAHEYFDAQDFSGARMFIHGLNLERLESNTATCALAIAAMMWRQGDCENVYHQGFADAVQARLVALTNQDYAAKLVSGLR